MKITIENLQKRFGETVACDIPSLTVGEGETLGLVGNNGAGKTTLFRLALDLQRADSGAVWMESEGLKPVNVAESEEWKPLVGAYLDEGFLIDYLTPEEYFAFLAKIGGLSKAEADERLGEMEPLAAGEIFGRKTLIRNLSAGNKQKVGIMSAFFRHPELVVLDEPFNFLDPTSQSVLKRMVRDYCAERKATVLVSSHNLTHTIDISTRIVLLEHGRIIRDLPNDGDTSVEKELKDYFEGDKRLS